MNPKRTLLSALALALAAPALVVGCGGDGGGDEDPAEVLRAALTQDVDYQSGVINIGVDGSLEGEQSGSLQADVSGPFQQTEGEAIEMALDATASVDAEGLPQVPGGSISFDFEGGMALADEGLFVTYNDTTYEASDELYADVAPFLESASQASEEVQSTEDPDSFIESLENLENEGTEDIDGESTTHVSGDLNFASLIEQSGQQLPIDSAQLEGLTATIDAFVAEDDDHLRQMDFTLIAEDVQALQSSGIEGGNLTFSFGVSEPNTEQTIEAPTATEPLDDLLAQFGSSERELSQALQGGLPFPGAGLGGGLETQPGGAGAGGGGGGAGGDAGGAVDPEGQLDELNELSECLESAGQDQDAIQACLEQ